MEDMGDTVDMEDMVDMEGMVDIAVATVVTEVMDMVIRLGNVDFHKRL